MEPPPAEENICVVSETCEMSQQRSWSKAYANLNIMYMLVTRETSHDERTTTMVLAVLMRYFWLQL